MHHLLFSNVKFDIMGIIWLWNKIKLMYLTSLCSSTLIWRHWFLCRSVSTGRLSEQPIRITLGGQAYQGSTDSLNTERPMDTGQSTVFTLTFFFLTTKFYHLKAVSSSQSPCRSEWAGAGWVSKSSDCPLYSGFTAKQHHSSHMQSPGHTAAHHIRWGTHILAILSAFSGFSKRVCPLPLCVCFSQWAPTVQLAPCAPPVVGSMSDLLLVWPWARPPQEGLLVAMLFLGAREHPAACAMSPMGRPLPAWRDSSLLKPLSSPRRHSWRWGNMSDVVFLCSLLIFREF